MEGEHCRQGICKMNDKLISGVERVLNKLAEKSGVHIFSEEETERVCMRVNKSMEETRREYDLREAESERRGEKLYIIC